MFGSIWNFVKRQRRKFFFSGAVIGGGYLLYCFVMKKLKDFRDQQEKDANECFEHARRQHHFDSNQRTCNMTVLSMLPNLRDSLIQSLNTESKLEELREKSNNKIKTWEELKIMSFARTISSVYASSLMALLLRVQLNIVGGYMYLDNLVNSSVEVNGTNGMTHLTAAPPEVQERYLALIKYYLSYGVSDLVNMVHSCVAKEIGSISLKEKISYIHFETVLSHIRERVELGTHLSDAPATLPLCYYMLPAEKLHLKEETPEDKLYDRLMQETRDVIESPDFHVVLKACLNRGFHKLSDLVAENYKQNTQPGMPSLYETEIPMAKLIPIVNSMVHKMCSDAPNPYVQEILVLDQMKNLAANIYEAFSQQDNQPMDIINSNVP